MRASRLFATVAALMLALGACTEAADTTTTAGIEEPTGEGTSTTATGSTATTAASEEPAAGGLLADVIARDELNCGTPRRVARILRVDRRR